MTEIDPFGPALRAEHDSRDPYLTGLVAIAHALGLSTAELVALGA